MNAMARLQVFVLLFSTMIPSLYAQSFEDIRIKSHDGVILDATLYKPQMGGNEQPLPILVFANSWTLNKKQYHEEALVFSKKGYWVLSYSTRGFGRSGGLASAASPDDIKDVSVLLDWLEANTNAHMERVGMAGISYGGGISLLAAAADDRIKAVASMSGWSDLKEAFFGEGTLRISLMKILIDTGSFMGRVDPQFKILLNDLKQNPNEDTVTQWTHIRSASHFVDKLNENQTAIFMSNNFKDYLFSPIQGIRLFEKLTGPKRLYMNPGIHASAEALDIGGSKSLLWGELHSWFDFFLKNIDSGINYENTVTITGPDGSETYKTLPKGIKSVDLKPKNEVVQGQLSVDYGRFTGATTGIPLLMSAVQSHSKLPIKTWIKSIRKNYAAVYESESIGGRQEYRGIPRLSLTATPMAEDLHLVAYVYDVDEYGFGTLISHGVVTRHRLNPGETQSLSFSLNPMSHDLEAGHKISLVIDSYDPLYLRPKNGGAFTIVHDDDEKLQLTMPHY